MINETILYSVNVTESFPKLSRSVRIRYNITKTGYTTVTVEQFDEVGEVVQSWELRHREDVTGLGWGKAMAELILGAPVAVAITNDGDLFVEIKN